MAEVYLITGGARSGKSAYSERLAQELSAPRNYIATAPVLDAEMRDRVKHHQMLRAGANWHTIEEQLDIAAAIQQVKSGETILVDCLTLWINNLMFAAERASQQLEESDIIELCRELQQVCGAHCGRIIFVINEVGLGIVPDNPASRKFRDLSGRCSQAIAGFADHVILVACGLPLKLKG
ncbi:bifunctional adenosylcobinamide kinase/adenosylcobinamide-phosphate guanylyltransferase [Lentisphaerota bacterium ZTH]|nr:bifunctional adenosylcobinamide kinase/adenosylcobinamide-phosphate guanylyltransferase [Lentisphaerota bacterium]WET07557.1 bifunctional adenosylcobinamide kinase/adenosylcobinamide-phosphate guanylyltransferase [Lentisphaerota bacterium ZTH]